MPAEVWRLATRDPDIAHAAVNDLFLTEQPIRFFGRPTDFRFSVQSAQAGGLSSDRLRHTMDTKLTMGPPNYFMAVLVTDGTLNFESGREQVAMPVGGVARYPSQAVLSAGWSDIRAVTIRLPNAILEQAAEGLGLAGSDLRFDGMSPLNRSAERRWRRLIAWIDSELVMPDSAFDSPLIAAQAANMVAVTALSTFPNTTLGIGELTGPGRVAPAALRRAIAFVDANAGRPITLTEMAAAAGVGPRALQEAFRRHYDTTPRAYLRRVRLHAAHRQLQAADSTRGDTVSAIAAAWGFARVDRFSAAYRHHFGVPPAHTLRT